LATLQDEARKFNSRENLFGMDTTDYNKISNMVKEFTPYSNLWITGHNWFTNIQKWMHGEW
jgi:dynein heavy chain